MPEKLKPCPFCGYPAIDAGQIDSQGTLEICCSHCGAMIRELDYKQLVDEWNRRAQQPNEPLTVDELREMIGQWVWVESKDVLCPNGWYRVEPQFREAVSLEGVDGTIYETSIANGDSAAYRRPPEEGEKE